MRVLYDACPLCGAGDIPAFAHANCTAHPLYREPLPPEMIWCRCAACDHVFTNGYFTPEAQAILFSRSNAHQQVNPADERGREICGRIVERVARLRPPPGRWLDVGFGSGALLFAAHEWGFEPVGIEAREAHVAAMTALGIEAYRDYSAECFASYGTFSVISMLDVLEHLPFPKAALTMAHARLVPGGALLVSTPNAGSIQWEALTRNRANPYWAEIEHFHNFTRSRLSDLLLKCGLAPLSFSISARYRLGMEIIAVRA